MPRSFFTGSSCVSVFDADPMEPTTAKNWLAAIRGLITHAIRSDLIAHDTTLGVKLRRMRGDGFHTWTEEPIAQFEAAHPRR